MDERMTLVLISLLSSYQKLYTNRNNNNNDNNNNTDNNIDTNNNIHDRIFFDMKKKHFRHELVPSLL